jgi:hypothetical protein
LGARGGAAYREVWLVIAAGGLAGCLTLAATGTGVAWASVAPQLMAIGLLTALHAFYTRFRGDPKISGICGHLAVVMSAMFLSAVISHPGLRLGMPYVDHILSAADAAIGWHSPDVVIEFAKYPLFSGVLAVIYFNALPTVIVFGVSLATLGKADRAEEYAWCFALCMLVAAIASIFMPALGSTVYHGVEFIPGLPKDAGNYHMDAVDYYRYNPSGPFDLSKVSGIVTFPSFHIAMALLIPFSLRGTDGPFWCAAVWAGLVGISSIVIGGHYLVDLIVGALCWAAAARLAPCRMPDGGEAPTERLSTAGLATP